MREHFNKRKATMSTNAAPPNAIPTIAPTDNTFEEPSEPSEFVSLNKKVIHDLECNSDAQNASLNGCTIVWRSTIPQAIVFSGDTRSTYILILKFAPDFPLKSIVLVK